MVHTHLTRHALSSWPSQESLCIAAINGVVGPGTASAGGSKVVSELLSVTLCGSSERVQWWLAVDSNAKTLTPPHAWHHPVLGANAATESSAALKELPTSTKPGVLFPSASALQPPLPPPLPPPQPPLPLPPGGSHDSLLKDSVPTDLALSLSLPSPVIRPHPSFLS